MQVSEVLRVKGNRLVTVPPDAMLVDCAMTMARHDIGSLLVMNGAAFVGIVTFREVLRVLAKRQIEHRIASNPGVDVAVREVMIPSPYLATPTMDVNEMRLLMIEHRQRYLPVMEGDLLLGVISFHDVAKAVLEERGFQNRMQRSYIRHWPAEL